MNKNLPPFGQMSFDEPQIILDEHAVWNDIQAAYKGMNHHYDVHLIPEVFARWAQFEDHLLKHGMQAAYAYYLYDFQQMINMTLVKASDEFAVDLMSVLAELNLVNMTMVVDFSKRNLDCLEVEKSALESVLRTKQYLIETDRQKELGSVGELLIKYCEEPRPEFMKLILDEVLAHLRHQPTLYHFCITIPFNTFRKSVKGFYPEWVVDNQNQLSRKLSGYSSKAITDSHIFYFSKAKAEELANTLLPNIGRVNDYRKVAKLRNDFNMTINEDAWKDFLQQNPKQALAYVMSSPEEFKGVDLAQPRYSEITMHKHVHEALALLRSHKVEIDHNHVSQLIDNYTGNLRVEDLLDSLKFKPIGENDFRVLSTKLKRHTLESDFSL
jgi:hypothetical protein